MTHFILLAGNVVYSYENIFELVESAINEINKI